MSVLTGATVGGSKRPEGWILDASGVRGHRGALLPSGKGPKAGAEANLTFKVTVLQHNASGFHKWLQFLSSLLFITTSQAGLYQLWSRHGLKWRNQLIDVNHRFNTPCLRIKSDADRILNCCSVAVTLIQQAELLTGGQLVSLHLKVQINLENQPQMSLFPSKQSLGEDTTDTLVSSACLFLHHYNYRDVTQEIH